MRKERFCYWLPRFSLSVVVVGIIQDAVDTTSVLVKHIDIRFKLLRRLGLPEPGSSAAEIGVWNGDFSEQILDHLRPKRLYLVDPWQHDPRYPKRRYGSADEDSMENRYHSVRKRFRHRSEVVILREDSREVWNKIGPLDWVYVDGNHSFEYVLADLEGAHSRLKPGGILAGDDCHIPPDNRWPGVFAAVMAFLRSGKGRGYEVLALQHRQFVLRKPEQPVRELRGSVPNESRRLVAVLSQPRSGTHLLRNLLNSHPDIRCIGELFHPSTPVRAIERFPADTPASSVLDGLFDDKASQNRHLGFPVHDAAGRRRGRFHWNHGVLLDKRPAPLLVWLTRRNKLAQYASWLAALDSQNWADYTGPNPAGSEVPPRKPVGPFAPEPEDFARWIRREETIRSELRKVLSPLPSVEIVYEDLCKNPVQECSRIFAVLQIAPHPVETPTNPIRGYRLPEIFTNYEDLVRVYAREHERTLTADG